MREKPVSDSKARGMRGQSLVEYALILTLIGLALVAILAVTGPAVGNVFSNTVYNLVGQDPDDVLLLTQVGGADSFWETVTWVAANPIQEQPFPTQPQVPTTNPTPGPSPTARPTQPTDTPSPTATFTVSPTAVDDGHNLPFVEDVDDEEVMLRWRLDNSLYLGGSQWFAEYYENVDFTTSSAQPLAFWHNQISSTKQNVFHLDFDWGTGFPFVHAGVNWPTNGGARKDEFSIRYTRKIYIDNPNTILRFGAWAANSINVNVDGNDIITINDTNPNDELLDELQYQDVTLGVGEHTVIVEYQEYGGVGGLGLSITLAGGSDAEINPDDDVDTGDASSRCNWGRWNTRNASSLEWTFDEDVADPDGAGPNVTCHLELRGFLETGGSANVVMTFWDVWDFTGGGQAKVQVAEYVDDPAPVPLPPSGSPVLDRGSTTWTTIPIHTGSNLNYEWTRQEIDLSAAMGGTVPEQLAVRFIIENAGGTSCCRRWYVDDIVIKEETAAPDVVTIGDFFDMNNINAKNDFVTSERWDLTGDLYYGVGGLAWDDSPSYSTDPFIVANPSPTTRVHYVELKDPVDLTLTSFDPAVDADIEGDLGAPLLSFWHSFNVATGTILQVEWSRDPRDDLSDGSSDTWTRLGVTPLVDNTAGNQNRADWRTMQFIELALDTIPNWNTEPFRLRWAMYVDGNYVEVDDNKAGWHIDNIYLERESASSAAPYPFDDTVESDIFTRSNWLLIGWARTGADGRRSGTSYADSPVGNYQPNTNNSMQLKNPFDLNNDSPNLTGAFGDAGYVPNYTATPNNPVLSFWHKRDLASGATFYVDMHFQTTDTWLPIWQYTWGENSPSFADADTQQAWERVEINLIEAYEETTGSSWATIAGNADRLDDDVKIAFRLQNVTTSTADGVFVDDIEVKDLNEQFWHLWDDSENHSGYDGDGESYLLDLENGDWRDDFYVGGDWNRTSANPRSGLRLIEDSPSGDDYRADTVSILEIDRIIDLRGVQSSDDPTLYFWHRYDIHSSDELYVQVTERDTNEDDQTYDRIFHWDEWDDRWPGRRRNANRYDDDRRFAQYQRINTGWHRSQVDLTNYAGEEIRVRFIVESVDDDGSVGDGWFLDNIRFTHNANQRIFTLGFLDLAQSTSNWVTEEDWGLALDFWKDTGGGPAQLGFNPWEVAFANCDRLKDPPFSNSDPWNYTTWRGCDEPGDDAPRFDTLVDWARGDLVDPNTNNVIPATGIYYHEETVNDPLILWYGSSRPGWATHNRWNDRWAAYITRRVTIENFSTYTFQTIADDGARAKIVGPIGAPAGQQINPDDDWNISNLWGPFPSGAVQSANSITLAPGEYDIIINWAEGTGSAFLSFTVANNNFSFTNSPNTPNELGGFDVVNSLPYSDTALVLDGFLDLRGSPDPVMEYYAHWAMGSNSDSGKRSFTTGEYSTDGGFSWTTSGAGSDLTGPGVNIPMDGTTYTGNNNFFNNGWRLRRHNLYRAAGFFTTWRFRVIVRTDEDNWQGDGFYFTEMRVNDGFGGTNTGTGTQDAPEITSVILVNTDTRQDIGPLLDGDTINLGVQPPNLSLRVETFPVVINGSVRFTWTNGTGSGNRVESDDPYYLDGDYVPYNFQVGSFDIDMTAYSEDGGNGNAGPTANYSFNIIGP
jgi:pilus assembly protein Flp/PilA